jgi:two-component system alkaline phosphatase synthesis response regulator PhoP
MHRVLVIDDHHQTHRLIRMALTRLEVEVLQALDGVSGVALARVERPHLILLDRTMPEKGGIEVLEELKASDETRDIPVVMLTAQDADEEIAEVMRRGADHFVAKPFSPDALRQLVQRLLAELPA